MSVIFDYKCKKCGFVFESKEEYTVTELPCRNEGCDGISIKQFNCFNFIPFEGSYAWNNGSRAARIKRSIDKDKQCQ